MEEISCLTFEYLEEPVLGVCLKVVLDELDGVFVIFKPDRVVG